MDNPAPCAITGTMRRDTDILISGGGLNGPVLALALAQAGFAVTIVDAAPRATRAARNFDGRAYALALASVRMLTRLGLWDALAPNAQPMTDIKAGDGRAGEGIAPGYLHFDSREIEEGPMGQMIEDRHLRPVLLDALDACGRITHLSETRITAQAPDATGITATLSTGATLRATLLAGCDGKASDTAARAGITRQGRDYGQTALVCAIAHERPHNGTAWQMFMPQGPLAILPLPGNRSSIVWTETTDMAREIDALPDADYLAILRPRFGDFLGDIRLDGARFTYPLEISLATALTAPRVALVGDAGHRLHPIAGQGLNAGLRDIAALTQVLTEARQRGEDPGTDPVLDRYAAWRRFDTTTLAAATDGFNRLFSNDNPWLRGLRDLGMGVVSQSPALRRAFIREAAGISGDLPRLMRG